MFCCVVLEVQRSLQAVHPAVDPEAVQHHGDHREVAVGAKPVDLPGGRVRRGGHRQAAASGQHEDPGGGQFALYHISQITSCYTFITSDLHHINYNLEHI